MIVYDGRGGVVKSGLLVGIRIDTRNGRGFRRPGSIMRRLMPMVAKELAARDLNIQANPRAAEAFWEFFIDMMHSPQDGLAHQAIASQPFERTVSDIEWEARH